MSSRLIYWNSLEIGFNEIDLEADYDPVQYDKQMGQLFNDNYYQEDEPGKKPVFDDDIDISDIVVPSEATTKKGKGKKKNQSIQEVLAKGKSDNSEIDKYLEEIYKLDYEDMASHLCMDTRILLTCNRNGN